jgi:hypothetical protein
MVSKRAHSFGVEATHESCPRRGELSFAAEIGGTRQRAAMGGFAVSLLTALVRIGGAALGAERARLAVENEAPLNSR